MNCLTITASFHRNDTSLGLHQSVNFGKPWQDDSSCNHGFISLPYLFGEDLEIFNFDNRHLNNLWLLPITKSERDYKMEFGWDALEERFDDCGLDYLNPQRPACA
ncbi:suppressor of fused domain protein [Hymenobacter negativus]|uniref:Suppressor of fused domain protein n=1 Tax=Hymenobacter negativus TaxID=2795026 RepID=A0ABS0Q9T9_9BACT|nr:suppressor of fused domain protein [Hymenobacter negativus]MBH8559098.1 suppressor of fused domain protein [Hymenobacter negativus]